MNLSNPAIAALLLVAGCGAGMPASAQGRPGSSPVTVCKDGSSFTLEGACGGHGGIDRAATRDKAARFRDTQAMGARQEDRPDEVWAMPAARTYACHGDRDFGTAREGQFMPEAKARARGMHPARGSCAASQHQGASR